MKKIYLFSLLFIASVSLFAQVNLTNGLKACYPFDGNANDFSGNSHNGTLSGPTLTSDRFGNPNSAYLYDGVNDYISLGTYHDIIPLSDEFSLSAWVQLNSVKLQAILMMYPDIINDRFVAAVYYDHNGQSWSFWDYGDISNGGRLYMANTIFSSNWEHYVFVTSNTGQFMKLYKNGVLVQSTSSNSQLVDRNREIRIGGGVDVSSALFNTDGKIDDLRIYDRAINDQEVLALYSGNISCTSQTAIAENFNSSFSINSTEIGLVYVNNPLMKNFSVCVYDISGKLVKNLSETSAKILSIDLSLLNQGVYSIRLKSTDGFTSKKFIKL